MYVDTRITGRTLQRLRNKLLRANPLCMMCLIYGRIRPATDLDHIIGLAQGGTNAEDNLQGLCHDCHADKTARENGKQRKTGCDGSGNPTGDTHHWNK